ncbi:MAG: hypothetical protein LBE34_07305 [Flavobacteriaceae bacterium]|nr:hypothetical protein [Flavobacteriaceae bacterium]
MYKYIRYIFAFIVGLILYFSLKDSKELLYAGYKEFLSADSTIPHSIIAFATYEKIPAQVTYRGTDTKSETYYRPDHSIIQLQTPDQKTIQYTTEYDSYNFYNQGETVNLYINKQTGETYIYDTNKQVDVLIQLGALQFIFILFGRITMVFQGVLKVYTVVGFQYVIRLFTFSWLFIQGLYTNIIIYNNNPTNENIPIHLISIVVAIFYLVYIIRLIVYYREAKEKQMKRTLQSSS